MEPNLEIKLLSWNGVRVRGAWLPDIYIANRGFLHP